MVAYGFANAYAKPLVQALGPVRYVFLRGITLCVLLTGAAIVSGGHSASAVAIGATFLLGLAGYLPLLAFGHAIRHSRVGVVVPIAGTSPLITVVCAFLFLGVRLNALEWAAILMIIAANVAATLDFRYWRESSALQLSSGIPFALLAALGWGLFCFFLIPATRAVGPWLSACISEIGVTFAAGTHACITNRGLSLRGVLSGPLMINAALVGVASLGFTIGVHSFNVGIVSALSNSTGLVCAMVGYFAFRERLHTREMVAGLIMIAGVAVLSLAHP
jgi:drug/metabolite transporter (DMT)-like permease